MKVNFNNYNVIFKILKIITLLVIILLSYLVFYYNLINNRSIMIIKNNNIQELKKEINRDYNNIKKYLWKDISTKDCENIFLLNTSNYIEFKSITNKESIFLKKKSNYIRNNIKKLKTQCLHLYKVNLIKLNIKNKILNKKLIQKENIIKNKDLIIKNIPIIKKENIIYWKNNKKQFLEKKIKLPIQKKNSNTCVIDNLALILENKYWFKIKKDKIYKTLNKKNWEYWHSGYFLINKTWGHFIEKKGYQDFKILRKDLNIETKTWSDIIDFQKNLKKWDLLLFEIPMEIIYPNIKKFKGSNIYHAITVFSYNTKNNAIEYYNSLNWKFETLNFNKIKYNDKYLKYPFRKVNSI